MTSAPQSLTGHQKHDRSTSYAGKQLDGADFRNADLRGCDFTNASLRGADFSGARTGRSVPGNLVVALAALAMSVGLGVLAGLGGRYLATLITSDNPAQTSVGVVVAGAIIVLMISAVWKGLTYCVRYTLPPLLALAVFGGVVAVSQGAGSGVGALTVAAFVLLLLAFIALGALARAFAGSANMWFFLIVAVSGALAGRAVGGGIAAVAVAIVSMIIGRQSLGLRHSLPMLNRFTLQLAHKGGTTFEGADLTDTTFEGAAIRCTAFNGARLDGSNLFAKAAVIHLSTFDDGVHEKRPPSRIAARFRRHAPSHAT